MPTSPHLAVAHSTSPYVSAYGWSGSGFGAKFADPATLPTGTGRVGAFAASGDALAVAHSTSPFVSAYGWSGSGFGAKFADPATLPTGTGLAAAFVASGDALAVAHYNSPYVSAYGWSGSGFGAKFADPATLPTGTGRGAAFAAAGDALAVAHSTSPYVSAYGWSGSGFGSKFADPATLPTGDGYGVAFAATGDALAVAHNNSPYVSVYGWSGSGFGSKFADPATLPTGVAFGAAFAASGDALAVAHATSPYVSAYGWSGSGFGSKFADPATLPTGTAFGIRYDVLPDPVGPQYESKAATGEAYDSTFTPAVPAGTAEGDLLIACCWMTSAEIDTPPAGWTQALAVDNASTYLNVYWKIAGASESAPTFSASSASYGEVILYRISNADGTSPIDVTGTATGSLDAPSVTTTGDDRFVLHLFGSSSGSGSSILVPTGDTALDEPSNFYCSLSSGYTSQATAGATGAATFDDGLVTFDQVTATLAIAPPGTAPPTGGVILERGLQHFWPLSNQDGSDVWAGDAFDDPPSPSVGSLTDGDTSPHPTLGSTRLTNDASTYTAVWQATSAAFDPDEYTFAGWMRPVYADPVQKGFQAGIDPSSNNIGGVTRHSDNAKTYGSDGGVGLVTRDISPSYESGNWQFACVRVSATDVTLNVDADVVTDSGRTVRSAGSANWRLYVGGNGASIAPVEYHGWGVWDRVLSDDEVTALRNGGTAIGFPLLTNGEAATALTLGDVGDMTPRLMPAISALTLGDVGEPLSPSLSPIESLTLAVDDATARILPAIAGLQLQADDATARILPQIEALQLAIDDATPRLMPQIETLQLSVDDSTPRILPQIEALQLAADDATPRLMPQIETLALQADDVTPPLLPSIEGLTLAPLYFGPELPDFIDGLTLSVDVYTPRILPQPETLTLAVEHSTPRILPQIEALAFQTGDFMPPVLPAIAGLTLAVDDATPRILPQIESLTLATSTLIGPHDLEPIESLTLTITGPVVSPVLPALEGLTLNPIVPSAPLVPEALTLSVDDLGATYLLTAPNSLVLVPLRLITSNHRRVKFSGFTLRTSSLRLSLVE